jgi:hypothetical protein
VIADLRGVIVDDPTRCRRAFQQRLGGDRMQVFEDPEQGFRVQGTFYLSMEKGERTPAQSPLAREVAGDRYARGCPPVRVPLPISGCLGSTSAG